MRQGWHRTGAVTTNIRNDIFCSNHCVGVSGHHESSFHTEVCRVTVTRHLFSSFRFTKKPSSVNWEANQSGTRYVSEREGNRGRERERDRETEREKEGEGERKRERGRERRGERERERELLLGEER